MEVYIADSLTHFFTSKLLIRSTVFSWTPLGGGKAKESAVLAHSELTIAT
jgi:hypothetical protein